jgi:serine O-acetyltransferase
MAIGEYIKEDYLRKFCIQAPGDTRVTLVATIIGTVRDRGFRAVMLYRIGHYLYTRGYKLLAELVSRVMHRLCFCHIAVTADIGPGFIVHHPFGLAIGADVKAGKNFNVRLGSTFGGRRDKARPDGSKYPKIGDNVTVGEGARVLGPVDIGDNCIIGANSVVISDVPDGCTVAGTPARIIKRNGQRVSLLENKGELYDILRDLISRVEKLEEQVLREGEDS